MATEPSDEKCAFAVIVTTMTGERSFDRIAFVMAKDSIEAQILALQKLVGKLTCIPQLSTKAFVVDDAMFEAVLPEVKKVAEAYFNAGFKLDDTFEELWDREGPGLEP